MAFVFLHILIQVEKIQRDKSHTILVLLETPDKYTMTHTCIQ